jgi:phenylalanyl-tRNA synthetase beta chain
MKICESWLRDWVAYELPGDELPNRLTMLGLEVDALEPVAPPSSGVVVGEVLERRRHPNADKLSLCRVSVGIETLDVVCGAANVREGGRYPLARVGARLPGGMEIRATRIRGEASSGMLCSALELGIDTGEEGLLELPDDAPVGTNVVEYLALDDRVIDLNVTPNRADCFSIAGIAREIAVAGGQRREVAAAAVAPVIPDVFPVNIAQPGDCPRFAGRVIRQINPAARTPLWLRERLRRCGVRPIHPVVDVTNYVMLELGQPMHAYDLGRLQGGIQVRRGRPEERLTLLDGREIRLDPDMLVIADERQPVGLAGIMGGIGSGVDASSRDIYLESAFFTPAVVAGRARRLGLHTDASVRFERGVDPTLQARAIERATALIVEIAGGQAGPVADTIHDSQLPSRLPVRLRRARLHAVLGLAVEDATVVAILTGLGMSVAGWEAGWVVSAPACRFDIEREEDLIEEVARVHGYERIPETPGAAASQLGSAGESKVTPRQIRRALIARGYQEAITYSFVDPDTDRELGGGGAGLALANPISADLAVMRQSLWPGLLQVMTRNLNRQQSRVRVFEIGVRFVQQGATLTEENVLSGAVVGTRLPQQWGSSPATVDVYDVKSDLEALLALTGEADAFRFEAAHHPALHPGRSARIRRGAQAVGWIGELHPAVRRKLDIATSPLLFEIGVQAAFAARLPACQNLSRFPLVRRDLALVVDRGVSAAALVGAVRRMAPPALRDIVIFDIYTGPQVGPTEKSIAMGLILQDASRTLTDRDIDQMLESVIAALRRDFDARIRE